MSHLIRSGGDALPPMYNAVDELVQDVVSTLGWPEPSARAFVGGILARNHGHPLADAVATYLHDEWVDTSWPVCPVHGRHPMIVRPDDEYRTWRCPADLAVIAPVGELRSLKVEE